MLLLIKYTLLYGIVLMLVALGGMFSEHSGIINIALEGIMVIGGVAGVLTLTMLPAEMPVFLVVLISVLVAALAGMVYSLLLAFASINLKADQTIGGTALNLLATAIAVPAPACLRRASAGSGLCGHQCLQDALCRCCHFRCTGRDRRYGLHCAPGADLEL